MLDYVRCFWGSKNPFLRVESGYQKADWTDEDRLQRIDREEYQMSIKSVQSQKATNDKLCCSVLVEETLYT